MLTDTSDDMEKNVGFNLWVQSYPFFSFNIIVQISVGTFSEIIKGNEKVILYIWIIKFLSTHVQMQVITQAFFIKFPFLHPRAYIGMICNIHLNIFNCFCLERQKSKILKENMLNSASCNQQEI